MQPTQTLLDLLVEFYSARRAAGAAPQEAPSLNAAETLPSDTALERAAHFPFLP